MARPAAAAQPPCRSTANCEREQPPPQRLWASGAYRETWLEQSRPARPPSRSRFDLALSGVPPRFGSVRSPCETPVSPLELKRGRTSPQIGSYRQRFVVTGLSRGARPENRVNVTFLYLHRRGKELVRGCHSELALAFGIGSGFLARRTSRPVSCRFLHKFESQGFAVALNSVHKLWHSKCHADGFDANIVWSADAGNGPFGVERVGPLAAVHCGVDSAPIGSRPGDGLFGHVRIDPKV